MEVFLTVLKIAGLVILCILALVLFIILLILMLVFTVPVKYRGHLEVREDADFDFTVTWLLKAVRARLSTGEKGLLTQVWLLGKEIELGGGMTIDMVLDFLFPPVDDAVIQKENEEDRALSKEMQTGFDRAVADEEDFIDEEASPDTFLSRCADLILEKTEKLREKFRKLRRQKRFLQRERCQSALKLIWEFVVKIIKIVFPKEIQGVLDIGFESPADTGTALGILSAAIPITQDHLLVRPDFERQVLEGTLDFSTSVRIGGLVIAAVRFIFNKDVRYFMRRFRKYI